MPIVLSSIEGNSQWLDGGAMFGNAPRALWEKWLPPDDKGRIKLACRGLLICIDDSVILCETGIGTFFEPKMAERYGVTESHHVLLADLNRLGYDHTAITHVILSHLHFDHAGGLLAPYDSGRSEPELLFPNAQYVVGEEAFSRAVHPHPRDRASFIPGMTEQLQKSGRLWLVDRQGQLLDAAARERWPKEITFTFTHGHTPGHMHTTVHGADEAVTFAGDLIPGRAWVHVPITMGYDRFAEAVIDEKSALYKTVAGTDHWLFYTHDVGCVASKVVADAKGRFVPIAEQAKWERYTLP